jgi:hypothetical protein
LITDLTQRRKGAKKNPEGISSFSPALTDEIRLRRVADRKWKSTLKELNQISRRDATALR